MRMLHAKAQDDDVVISVWCAPGARTVNTRMGFLRDEDGQPYRDVQWCPVEVYRYVMPVWDVVDVLTHEFSVAGKRVTTSDGTGPLMYVFDYRERYGYVCRVPESQARRLVSENPFWDYDVVLPEPV